MRKMVMVHRTTPSPTTKVSPHFAVTGRILDPGLVKGKVPFHQHSGLTKVEQKEIHENLIASKEKSKKTHDSKRNVVHLV